MANKKQFCIFLLLVFFFVAAPLYAQDPAQATVSLSPTSTTLMVGETINVIIITQNVQQLYGFDLSLAFTNPDTIEIVDTDLNTEGVQVEFGTFLEPGFTLHNQVDHTAGTMRFAMTQVNPTPAKNGQGVLMMITIRALKPSTSTQLILTHVEQAQPRGIMLPTIIDPTPAQLHITDNPAQAEATTTTALAPSLFDPSTTTTPIPQTNPLTMPQESLILATTQCSLIFLLLLIVLLLMVWTRPPRS